MNDPNPPTTTPPRRKWRRAKLALALTFPLPVRALWEAASPEEQRRAQQVGTTLLEVWLGRLSRQDASTQLGLPAIRLAQLSKQAASGLVAGLLKQPKPRAKALKALQAAWGPNVQTLQRRVQELEQETRVQQELIQLLKAMPPLETGKKKNPPPPPTNRGRMPPAPPPRPPDPPRPSA